MAYRPTEQPTNRATDQPTDSEGSREVRVQRWEFIKENKKVTKQENKTRPRK